VVLPGDEPGVELEEVIPIEPEVRRDAPGSPGLRRPARPDPDEAD
jgi:hypothetical protein